MDEHIAALAFIVVLTAWSLVVDDPQEQPKEPVKWNVDTQRPRLPRPWKCITAETGIGAALQSI